MPVASLRLFGASATIENVEDVAAWLSCTLVDGVSLGGRAGGAELLRSPSAVVGSARLGMSGCGERIGVRERLRGVASVVKRAGCS